MYLLQMLVQMRKSQVQGHQEWAWRNIWRLLEAARCCETKHSRTVTGGAMRRVASWTMDRTGEVQLQLGSPEPSGDEENLPTLPSLRCIGSRGGRHNEVQPGYLWVGILAQRWTTPGSSYLPQHLEWNDSGNNMSVSLLCVLQLQ